MKYLIYSVFAVIILISQGCDSKSKSNANNVWRSLTIRSEGSSAITVDNYSDTAMLTVRPIFDLFTSKPADKITITTTKIYFTKAEKDSIYNMVKSIISNPIEVKRNCTEFVGHLELTIDYGQFKQSGEYTSVCDWNTLSDKTILLHNMLKRKTKGIYWGEQNINL